MSEKPKRVALFVTCLVDMFRPEIGFAAVKLLEDAGCIVEAPAGQTCCGQPAYNSGDRADATAIARHNIALLAGFDYVVLPSGSCAGMIAKHYPLLFEDDPEMAGKARELAQRTFELTSFLVDVLGVEAVAGASHPGKATYHDSCSGLRELGVKTQPRKLLGSVAGLTVSELAAPEECCGFGGTFCVKYPEISDRMVSDKAADATATGAALVLGGDLGCLMNIAGKLKRQGSPIAVRHVAEVLAGGALVAPIGESGEE
ncbi:MAG: (Fe-S)-binding protein [Alphaproteobacteria bacterium]|nr:(Fe-S)-binding protein [Alphaproteobacteria bacterium]